MTNPEREHKRDILHLPPRALLSTITPLRLIFWGGLLVIIDFRVNGFDILNDFLGMILITLGVFRLGRIPIAQSYVRGMGFVKVVAVVSTILTFINQFAIKKPPALQFFWTLSGLVDLAAIIVFVATMRLFCVASGLDFAAASWRRTMMLFVALYALPLGFC